MVQVDDLPKHLYESIHDDKLADLMADDSSIARERAKIGASLERFRRARDVLKDMTSTGRA